MRTINHWIILSLAALLMLTQCKESTKPIDKKALTKDMAAIDKALIPALYLTSIDKQFSSLEAMSQLTPQINHFIQKYEHKNPTDKQWDRDLGNIKSKLKYANQHVRANQLKQANIQDLDPMSTIFVQMRSRNGLDDYIPDQIHHLHSTSLSLASSISPQIPEDAQEVVINSTKTMYASVKKKFQQLKSEKMDNTLYSVPPKKRKYLMEVYGEVDKVLAQIDTALTSMDTHKINEAYGQLPKHFIEAYLVFGDFEVLQKK